MPLLGSCPIEYSHINIFQCCLRWKKKMEVRVPINWKIVEYVLIYLLCKTVVSQLDWNSSVLISGTPGQEQNKMDSLVIYKVLYGV